MVGKMVAAITVGAVLCASAGWAGEPNDYIVPGRALLFDGTLTGLRQAYTVFDNGVNDPSCSSDRELRFLRAISGTAMLLVGDEGGQADSVFELAERFGLDVVGDYWTPFFEGVGLEMVAPLNEREAYEIPEGAPDTDEIRDIIDASMVPAIDKILSDLNSISDSPGDRFRVFFDPNEMRVFSDAKAAPLQFDLEVDYGEVLILKALLTMLKGQLESQSAYDLYTDANDLLIERLLGETFSINDDLLTPYPEFLTVLPTSNDANTDGAALLAQAVQDVNEAVDYYFEALDYILNEDNPVGTDPQYDELVYLDPNSQFLLDRYNERVRSFRDSLMNDTVMEWPESHTKTYLLYDGGATAIGELVLTWWYGFWMDGDGESLTFSDPGVSPSTWQVGSFGLSGGSELWVDVENFDNGWRAGYLEGTFAADGNSFSQGEFWYMDSNWEWVGMQGFYGEAVDTKVAYVKVDFNPIFGGSPRYPDPVNPRDLLPEFDAWNAGQPGTLGHGAGDDPTLGGVLPEATQFFWQTELDLQPGGEFVLSNIRVGRVSVDGETGDWRSESLVFDDIEDDTDEHLFGEMHSELLAAGVDIDKLYLAYDDTNLYGAITLYDAIDIPATGENEYYIAMHHASDDSEGLDALAFYIYADSDGIEAALFHKVYEGSDCWQSWRYITQVDVARGSNAIEFSIPLAELPAPLWGRFLSLRSVVYREIDGLYMDENQDENYTHLKIGDNLGTISGTVSYSDYDGLPIYVDAFGDPHDGEDVVASTMITGPGVYTLEGIGIGWAGYVRARTSVFGANPFEYDTLMVEDAVAVKLDTGSLTNVNLSLKNPTVLQSGVWTEGEIVLGKANEYFAFDAIEGVGYTVEVDETIPYDRRLELYGRAPDDMIEVNYAAPGGLAIRDWLCPASGRYYAVVGTQCEISNQSYEIRMAASNILFQDSFGDGDYSGWKVVDEGVSDAPSSWSVVDGVMVQSSNIFSGDGIQIDMPGTYAYYEDGTGWQDYRVRLSVRSDDDDGIGLMFRYQSQGDYYRFSWDKQRSRRRLVKVVGGEHTLLAQDEVPYVTGRSYALAIVACGPIVQVFVDDKLVFWVRDRSLESGSIGLYSWGNTGSHFDDVLVEKTSATDLAETFDDGDHDGWLIFDEGVSYAPSLWSAATGQMVQQSNIYGGDGVQIDMPGTYAVYKHGVCWEDCRIDLSMKSDDDDGIGVMFRYQDKDNYYRFSLDSQRKYRRLVKKENGVFTLLAADGVAYPTGRTYQLEILACGPILQVLMDDEPALWASDSSFESGSVALYTWGNAGSYFDDVNVTNVPELELVDLNRDGALDWKDATVLGGHWLADDCTAAGGWCAGADVIRSGAVDFADYCVLAGFWLSE